MDERIQRVAEMEERMNRIADWLEDPAEESVAEDVRVLDAYYRSPLWLEDFEADEAGLFPDGMPRGVLSEDGIYNLMAEYEDRMNTDA